MLTLEEIQAVELETLKKLHAFLEKHDLRYCLAFGTLLGAVRHQGFIPWDNDMDIVMPRPDYERLLELLKTEPIAEDVGYSHYDVDPNYHYTYMRVFDTRTVMTADYIWDKLENMGVWIDVFPLDGLPESPWEHPFAQLRMKLLRKMQVFDTYRSNNASKQAVRRAVRFLLPNRNNSHPRQVNRDAMRFPYESSEYVADVVENGATLIPMTHDDLDEAVLLPFGDGMFRAPKNWERYLKNAYGDYMRLPPEEQRFTHPIDVHWR